MKILINTIYLLAVLLVSPKFFYRMIFHKRYRKGWSQRFGKITRKSPDKKCIWIHAVSVGEVNATRTLISALTAEFPDYEIVISSTTDTGFARACTVYDDELSVFYYPFDFSFIVNRAFTNIKPDLCILMELELWPNFTSVATRRKVPIVIVNGRISDRSFPRYKLIRPFTKWMFSRVTLILAQTKEYAERFKYLGCPSEKVKITNSLKYDTAQTTHTVEGADVLAQQLNIDRDKDRIWVAGGTGPGEEQIILDVFTKLKADSRFGDLRLIIVPRKPERFDEVAAMINQTQLDYIRYSMIKNEQLSIQTRPTIILGDTMGDLRKFYSLAEIVLVGRSMVPMGGSDMMESTALGKCTIFGKYTFNFKQTVDELLASKGAIEIQEPGQLPEIMIRCLADREYACMIARNGQNVIIQNQGATRKTIKAIEKILSG